MGYAHRMKSGRHITRFVAAARSGGRRRHRRRSRVPRLQYTRSTCASLCGGGEFHPLTPVRVFDSRPASAINDVAPLGAKPLAAPEPAVFDIAMLGLGGIPATAADVLAVVLNITVTEPGASGYLEAYGKGAKPATRTSIINFAANQTVPNVSIVRPGADGQVKIGLFGQNSTAQVIVDVFGWFSPAPAATSPRREAPG